MSIYVSPEYADGAAVDAALDLAGTAAQPITLVSAPTPTATGKKGQFGYYANYLYVWSEDNVVRRVAAESTWA